MLSWQQSVTSLLYTVSILVSYLYKFLTEQVSITNIQMTCCSTRWYIIIFLLSQLPNWHFRYSAIDFSLIIPIIHPFPNAGRPTKRTTFFWFHWLLMVDLVLISRNNACEFHSKILPLLKFYHLRNVFNTNCHAYLWLSHALNYIVVSFSIQWNYYLRY